MIRSRFANLRVLLLGGALVSAFLPAGVRADDGGAASAVAALHAAIESRDIAKMDAVWAHDGGVMVVNPIDKTIVVGWDSVRSRWIDTFRRLADVRIMQADGPHVTTKGDVAWSMGVAHVLLTLASGEKRDVQYLEADVFQRQGTGWLIVSHVARPIEP